MAEHTEVEVRLLSTADELHAVDDLFELVWGRGVPVIGSELLHVIGFTGGYVSGAFVDGTLVGASVALRGVHNGLPSLHSHATGVLDTARGLAVGQRMKAHQRAWAAGTDVAVVTWTFDPLVRRNAWFNLGRLGARVAAYYPNFYGPMSDAINAGDESDRLLAVWDVVPTGEPVTEALPSDELVSTPDDIESLRRQDLPAALRWRREVRAALSAAANAGEVVGFTRAGDYIVRSGHGTQRPSAPQEAS